MAGKVIKLVVDVILSIMFFIVAAILVNWIAGLIFGTKSNGDADFNGGILLIVTTLLTLAFAIWFYRYVHLRKGSSKEAPEERAE